MLPGFFVFSQGFKKVKESQSNITFDNKVFENDSINGITFPFLYQYGGIAVGDINNDGLEDLFFTGRQIEDELYLNKGELSFKNVTSKYFNNKSPSIYHTGAVMVDINNDGWLDIYVSVAGPNAKGAERANLLYLNKKGKVFVESAELFGLADTSNTTQTVFFDADLDGDLDCFMLNHIRKVVNMQVNFPLIERYSLNTGKDKFYLNEGGVFVEKTKEFGLEFSGEGLGVVVSDFNNDGYPDIYVTNDGLTPDRLFTNNKGHGFINSINDQVNHSSLFAMGVDAGDINNDGLIDIITVDMANEDHVKSKKNMSGMSTKNFWLNVKASNQYQYMYNSLQLNMGGDNFSEIAQLAGVSNSDWSWAPLFADFDNDGFQDLFISNGFHRNLKDNDYVKWLERDITYSQEKYSFNDVKKRIPKTKTANYIYKNNGDLTFSKKNFEWGMAELINANGAVYSDLDNDGDLDLVLNITNEKSFVMENVSTNANGFLDVKLYGIFNNINCLGAKVQIVCGETNQYKELQTVRGYQSSVSSKLHFGVGLATKIDTLIVTWNNKEQTVLIDIVPNQLLKIEYQTSIKTERKLEQKKTFFTKTEINGLSSYIHKEFSINDFEEEVLLPHKMSELGPFITVEDINNDGLDDVFIGGARSYTSKMYFQNSKGWFDLKQQPDIEKDKNFEDMQAVFFDFDNDGDKDLYVVSGSNESPIAHASLQDRLYVNSNGVFEKTAAILPDIRVSGQKVIAEDVNNDGWIDLVVFGRQVPKAYPTTPKTSILINRNGKFSNEVKNIAPELELVGMVTDAIFTDFDKDGDKDLIVVGEWMPITVFENIDNQYVNMTKKFNLNETVGWWSAIKEVKTKDGKKYILGNIGKNNKYHPSQNKPLQIYMDDFDDNGTNDIVLAKYQGKICYPVRGRQCSSEQMPFIVDKFPTYTDYATANLASIYSEDKLTASIHFKATKFESSILSFNNGVFELAELANELQVGCINTILEANVNGDDIMDYLCLGNKYEAEVETIRYDGNYGGVLLGQNEGGFMHSLNNESGLYLKSNVKDGSFISIKGITYLIVVSNSEKINILKLN